MLAGLGVTQGLVIRWCENLLARYNRHVASLASASVEAREDIYHEALQYKAALLVAEQIRKGVESDWGEFREELEYYIDWEIGDPLFGYLPEEK